MFPINKKSSWGAGSGARRSGSKVATAEPPPSLLGQIPCLARGYSALPARRLGSWSGRSVDLPSFLRELTELIARVRVLPWSTILAEISLLRRETASGIVLFYRGFARRLRSIIYPSSVDLPSFLGKLTEQLGARSSCSVSITAAVVVGRHIHRRLAIRSSRALTYISSAYVIQVYTIPRNGAYLNEHAESLPDSGKPSVLRD